jgi:hypothetical protein
VAEADDCVCPRQGSDPLGFTVNTTYVHLIIFLAPESKDTHDAKNKAVD